MRRRDVLKLALAAGGAGALAARAAAAQDEDLLKYLCPPDGFPDLLSRSSPKAEAFAAELFVPPVKRPVAALDPPPNPRIPLRAPAGRGTTRLPRARGCAPGASAGRARSACDSTHTSRSRSPTTRS